MNCTLIIGPIALAAILVGALAGVSARNMESLLMRGPIVRAILRFTAC